MKRTTGKTAVGAVAFGLMVSVGVSWSTAAADPSSLLSVLQKSWVDNAYWHDGKAEVNLYKASLVMYGKPRPAESVAHIIVTEKHRPDLLVKADDWRQPDLVDILKFNYVTNVRTGVYSYQQMLSFFFDRQDLHLAKMTLASHEWCGNTFKQLVNFRGKSSFSFNTYWDGQGEGSFPVEFPVDLVVYESLPVQLRALPFAVGFKTELSLLPRQLSSQVAPPQIEIAQLEVVGREDLRVAAGRFETWVVELRHKAGTDRLFFEAPFPHRLVRWQAAAGNLFELAKSKKLAYWQLTDLGDESALD
jgi:hypothetical protein